MWHWSQGLCMTMNLWNIQCALIFLNVQNKFFALLAVAPGNHLVHGIYNKTIFWSHTLVLFCITYIAYLCLIPFCKIMKHGIQYQDSKDLVRFVCFSFYLFSKPIDLFGKVDIEWSLIDPSIMQRSGFSLLLEKLQYIVFRLCTHANLFGICLHNSI